MNAAPPTTTTTTPAPRPAPLLSEFAPATPAAWRAAAEALLKGAPFERTLHSRTLEGIERRPLYGPEDVANLPLHDLPGFASRRRGGQAEGHLLHAWGVSQEITPSDPADCNVAVRAALARGQTELNLPLDCATQAGRDPDDAEPATVGVGGLSLATVADLDRTLAGIELRNLAIYLRAGPSALPVAALLFALAQQRNVPFDALRGCIGSDPLGGLARDGRLPMPLESAYQEMASLTAFAIARAPRLQTLLVETHAWHDAGASSVQELACAIATGVAYLRELERLGVPAAEAATHVRFALNAGPDFFMEVAKFRAVRQLWTQAARAFGVPLDRAVMHLHVRTGTVNKTVYDAHANILRGTTEALSAVLGGCDSLQVAAFDAPAGGHDELAQRVARNTQLVLAEECDLTRVIDPAGGSYYVEWLTDEIARRAWGLFQEIEQDGGMAPAIVVGRPQSWVAATAKTRADQVARRRTVLVGTNQYPNSGENSSRSYTSGTSSRLEEQRHRLRTATRDRRQTAENSLRLDRLSIVAAQPGPVVLDAAIDAVAHGATVGDVCRSLRGRHEPVSNVVPVRAIRSAEPFERLRDAAARWRDAHGSAPLVFQANIGPSRRYRLRADWTSAFFAVGGFQVANEQDFVGSEDAAAAALAAGARLVVITSDDASYPSVVEPLARALKSQDPAITVLVAGQPKENEAAWRAAGVDCFVNLSSHPLDLLTHLLIRLGVLP